MSRVDIGSYIGLAKETVSRELGCLQRDGMLVLHAKHIEIVNVDQLADRAQAAKYVLDSPVA